MQEMHLFEYAVIRIVPRVEREEFFNVGVILFCKSLNFLKVKYHLDPLKCKAFCEEDNHDTFKEYLEGFEKIAKGGGPIGQYPKIERFRWLTANRSTIIQTSPVHPGLTHDPETKLGQLFEELVA